MKRLMQWMLAVLTCGASVFTACTSNIDNAGTKDDGHAQKALLVILDGWGIGDKGLGDVIARTATPYMDYLKANYPHTELQASGESENREWWEIIIENGVMKWTALRKKDDGTTYTATFEMTKVE